MSGNQQPPLRRNEQPPELTPEDEEVLDRALKEALAAGAYNVLPDFARAKKQAPPEDEDTKPRG
ncbi:MAG TPA: hypothetical protein VHO69_11190 [Phototrophicaceae bacterium]|nr:hypothetical protein [Phototrophicaceae bacterium]